MFDQCLTFFECFPEKEDDVLFIAVLWKIIDINIKFGCVLHLLFRQFLFCPHYKLNDKPIRAELMLNKQYSNNCLPCLINLINIMQNQEIKQKIEQVWQNIKTYKAPQLQSYLQLSTKKAKQIIGNNEIQKIRHSSLLKLLIYELVIFIDEKFASLPQQKTVRKGKNSNRTQQKFTSSLSKLNDVKDMVRSMSKGKSTTNQIVVDINRFNLLQQKVRSLERQIVREDQSKKRVQQNDSSDSQGTEVMIEQLEQIIKRKENRIKQLNLQLEENFNDKQQLEEEIEMLELNNIDLKQKIKQLQQTISTLSKKNQQAQKKNMQLLQELNKYKHKEKDQLLFGVSSFINHKLPEKHISTQDTTLQTDPLPLQHEPITNSTRILYKYCMPSITINSKIEEKTVKKPIKMIESESQEQDLLSSIKQYQSEAVLQNENHSLERLLLMQALFIQKALEGMEG